MGEFVMEDINKIDEQLSLAEKKTDLIFKAKEEAKPLEQKEDEKGKLVETVYTKGIEHIVQNDEEVQNDLLDSAKKFVKTKTQIIETKVDTEHKEAIFDNRKDACESYGFKEKTTPIWAIRLMTIGYDIMLAIWLFIGTFTFMPVIFVFKKISVGVKQVWLAIIFAIIIYFGVTVGIPLLAFINK